MSGHLCCARVGRARLGEGDVPRLVRLLDGVVLDRLGAPLGVLLWCAAEAKLNHKGRYDAEKARVVVELGLHKLAEAGGAIGGPVLVGADHKLIGAVGRLHLKLRRTAEGKRRVVSSLGGVAGRACERSG